MTETRSDESSVQRAERILAEAMLAESPKGMYELVCEAHAVLVNARAIHNESTLLREAKRALHELTQTKEPLPDEVRVSNARHILSDALTPTTPPHDVARDIAAEAVTRARSMYANSARWRDLGNVERSARSAGAAEAVHDMAGWIEHGEYNRGSVDVMTKARDALVAAGKAINAAMVHMPMRNRTVLSDAASAIVHSAVDADEFLRRWSKEEGRRRDELAKYQIDYTVLREVERIYDMEASTDLLVALRRDHEQAQIEKNVEWYREHAEQWRDLVKRFAAEDVEITDAASVMMLWEDTAEPETTPTNAPSSTRKFGFMKGSVLHYEEDPPPTTTAEIDEAREHAEYIVAHEQTLAPYLTHGYRIIARGLLAALQSNIPPPSPGLFRLACHCGIHIHHELGIAIAALQRHVEERHPNTDAGSPLFTEEVPCPESALQHLVNSTELSVEVVRCLKVYNKTHSAHFICASIGGKPPTTFIVLRDDHENGAHSNPLTFSSVAHSVTNLTEAEITMLNGRLPGGRPKPQPDDADVRRRLSTAMHDVKLHDLEEATALANLLKSTDLPLTLAAVARTPLLLDILLAHALEIRDCQSPDLFGDSKFPLAHSAMEILHNKTRETPRPPEWIVNDHAELGVRVNGHFYFLWKGRSMEYETKEELGGPGIQWRPVGKREFGESCLPPLEWTEQFPRILKEIREEIGQAELREYQGDDTQLGYANGVRFALDKINEGIATSPGRHRAPRCYTLGNWRDLPPAPTKANPNPDPYLVEAATLIERIRHEYASRGSLSSATGDELRRVQAILVEPLSVHKHVRAPDSEHCRVCGLRCP